MNQTAIVLMVSLLLLKVTGIVAMSWWWVLSPIWVPILACFVFAIGFGVLALAGFIIAMLVVGVLTLIDKVTA